MKLPKRPRSHVLATEAEKAFLGAVPDEWVVERKAADYGVDFEVLPFVDGEPTGATLAVQLKGTQKPILRDRLLRFTFPVRTLNYLRLGSAIPLVVLYVPGRGLFCLPVSWFVDDFLAVHRPGWQSRHTVRLYVPIENHVSRGGLGASVAGLLDPVGSEAGRRLQRFRILMRLGLPAAREEVRASMDRGLEPELALEYLPKLSDLFRGDTWAFGPLVRLVTEGLISRYQQDLVAEALDALKALAVAQGHELSAESLEPIRAFTGWSGVSVELRTRVLGTLRSIAPAIAGEVAEALLSVPYGSANVMAIEAYVSELGAALTAGPPARLEAWVRTLLETFVASFYDADPVIGNALLEALEKSPASLRSEVEKRLRAEAIDTCFHRGYLPDSEEIIRHYTEMRYHEFLGHSPEDG